MQDEQRCKNIAQIIQSDPNWKFLMLQKLDNTVDANYDKCDSIADLCGKYMNESDLFVSWYNRIDSKLTDAELIRIAISNYALMVGADKLETKLKEKNVYKAGDANNTIYSTKNVLIRPALLMTSFASIVFNFESGISNDIIQVVLYFEPIDRIKGNYLDRQLKCVVFKDFNPVFNTNLAFDELTPNLIKILIGRVK